MARARKSGLDSIIAPLLCDGHGIGARFELDFALICNALHETPDRAALLAELFTLLKPGSRFLLMEPCGHLRAGDFEAEVTIAKAAGFWEMDRPRIFRQMSILMQKPDVRHAHELEKRRVPPQAKTC